MSKENTKRSIGGNCKGKNAALSGQISYEGSLHNYLKKPQQIQLTLMT